MNTTRVRLSCTIGFGTFKVVALCWQDVAGQWHIVYCICRRRVSGAQARRTGHWLPRTVLRLQAGAQQVRQNAEVANGPSPRWRSVKTGGLNAEVAVAALYRSMTTGRLPWSCCVPMIWCSWGLQGQAIGHLGSSPSETCHELRQLTATSCTEGPLCEAGPTKWPAAAADTVLAPVPFYGMCSRKFPCQRCHARCILGTS